MRILVTDDDQNIRDSLDWLLTKEGHQVDMASTGEEGISYASSNHYDLAFCDVMMPGIGGFAAVEKMLAVQPELKIFMISGEADISMAVRATKLGAYDFFEKPLNPEKIILELKKLKEQEKTQDKVHELERLLELDQQMVGTSPPIQQMRETIHRAAPSDGRIMIFGENGTGKELVAREIHNNSTRKTQAFVKLNCAAIPKELIESELFGHEKGAFTGAHKRKPGHIEQAEGGTLFLDEIGDMALETQAKLLRVLQENEYTPVGSTKPIKFDVRIISATNKNIQHEIKAGNFREDLYFRLNVIPINVPSLLDRKDDIPILVDHFLGTYSVKNGKRKKSISSQAMAEFTSYNWPGNIRELKNIIERLSIMIAADQIEKNDVTKILGGIPKTIVTEPQNIDDSLSLKDQLAAFERSVLESTFKKLDGNISQMAVQLDTDRANLSKKLKKYGIK